MTAYLGRDAGRYDVHFDEDVLRERYLSSS
jgi:hypothetical protein